MITAISNTNTNTSQGAVAFQGRRVKTGGNPFKKGMETVEPSNKPSNIIDFIKVGGKKIKKAGIALFREILDLD